VEHAGLEKIVKGVRKFISEFALNMYSARWIMLPASELASGKEPDSLQQEILNASHIYLICKHPSCYFAWNTFRFEDGTITVRTRFKVRGEERQSEFTFPFPGGDEATGARLSDYPHRELHYLDKSGAPVMVLPAGMLTLAPESRDKHPELGCFEVLYVGQAFGDGTRSAFQRLQSHSTLQKILAESQYKYPDDEVNVFVFEYCPYRFITQMDGRAKQAIGDERDQKRFFSILENPLNKHQQISLIEAALIRYFTPEYNEIYKESFPSLSHKILKECYDLDFSGLIVEINTDELGFFLYSPKVPARMHHISKVDLFTPLDREGFFQLFESRKPAL
jgi:hypothetical protein